METTTATTVALDNGFRIVRTRGGWVVLWGHGVGMKTLTAPMRKADAEQEMLRWSAARLPVDAQGPGLAPTR